MQEFNALVSQQQGSVTMQTQHCPRGLLKRCFASSKCPDNFTPYSQWLGSHCTAWSMLRDTCAQKCPWAQKQSCPYSLNSVKIHCKSHVRCSHTTPPAVKCDGTARPDLSEHTAGPACATECSWESRREKVLLNHFHTELPSLGVFPAQHHFQDS